MTLNGQPLVLGENNTLPSLPNVIYLSKDIRSTLKTEHIEIYALFFFPDSISHYHHYFRIRTKPLDKIKHDIKFLRKEFILWILICLTALHVGVKLI